MPDFSELISDKDTLHDAALSIGARINDDIRAAIARLMAGRVDAGES